MYTALFGRYDGLVEQPSAAESDCDFICFTDDRELTSETWEIRHVTGAFAQDPVRSARMYKILGDSSLEEYDATLYIDASVRLRRAPEAILAEWLTEDVDIALSKHSYREQLADEFDEVVRLNYDDRSRVFEQLIDYSLDCPDILQARPLWTGVLARRRTSAVTATMRTWADHVLRYSRRDQLSVLVALRSSEASLRILGIDNFDSANHEWPVIAQRRISQGKAPVLPAGPVVVELLRTKRELAEITAGFEGRPGREVLESEQRERRRADAAEDRLDLVTRELETTAYALHQTDGVIGATRNLARAVARKFRRQS